MARLQSSGSEWHVRSGKNLFSTISDLFVFDDHLGSIIVNCADFWW